MTQANYAISKQMKGAAFDDAVAAVTERLKGEGFGVLTEIDVQKPLRRSSMWISVATLFSARVTQSWRIKR